MMRFKRNTILIINYTFLLDNVILIIYCTEFYS